MNAVKPSDAKREATSLLRATMQQEELAWPDVPEPVAMRCSDGGEGVRFQYLVHVEHSEDASALAARLEQYWQGRGLEVKSSEEDLGSKYGTVYSATARAASGPSGAIEVSRVGVNLYVDSPCAEGDIADYE